jgi:hypothetical protein
MFVLGLAGPAPAVVQKKVVKKKVVKKPVRPVARPKFPVDKGRVVAPSPKPAPVVVAPAPPPLRKAGWFVEGGLAGGAGAVEAGYGRRITDNLYLSGAAGYGVGGGFGVVVIDPLRINYEFGRYFAGAGLNYAMYSSANVQNVPGLAPGKISSQNMLGAELLGGLRLEKIVLMAGYGSALGIRVSAGYEF